MIDAKLKGEGIQPEKEIVPDRSNVVDLMSALKNSLGQVPAEAPEKPARKAKLPAAATQAAKSRRKRA
jgi:non-homologous end joining protein Ku